MARFNKAKERTTFIVECFEEFYRQVLKHKKFVLTKPWSEREGEAEASPNATAEFILTALKTFLEKQAVTASFGGNSFAENYYAEAQFIMVALADEVFLTLDWPGKPYWEANLLEQRLYNTHSAGQVFFERLDTLLQNMDPVRTDLAVLYLNALGLGFRGKYRHFDDGGELLNYRKRLFTFINRREPYLFQQKIHLFPDTYAHTLEGGEAKELSTFRNWYFVFGGICLVYLLASYIIWYSATADVARIVNRIITNTGVSE
ncbi:MAG TPA: DotU family type IV/VI secretion system protein [Alphaproteobacteria bacterium]|nr:DotU family type IV/VI secretion system protein [Alphaproteobacteria bacterium]